MTYFSDRKNPEPVAVTVEKCDIIRGRQRLDQKLISWWASVDVQSPDARHTYLRDDMIENRPTTGWDPEWMDYLSELECQEEYGMGEGAVCSLAETAAVLDAKRPELIEELKALINASNALKNQYDIASWHLCRNYQLDADQRAIFEEERADLLRRITPLDLQIISRRRLLRGDLT